MLTGVSPRLHTVRCRSARARLCLITTARVLRAGKGQRMSSHCKVVKVLSLLMFVLGLLAIIAGAVFVFAAPAVEGLEGVDDPVGTATALGAVFVVTGVLYLVVAVLGIRGANNPSKLGAFIVAAGVIAAINALSPRSTSSRRCSPVFRAALLGKTPCSRVWRLRACSRHLPRAKRPRASKIRSSRCLEPAFGPAFLCRCEPGPYRAAPCAVLRRASTSALSSGLGEPSGSPHASKKWLPANCRARKALWAPSLR